MPPLKGSGVSRPARAASGAPMAVVDHGPAVRARPLSQALGRAALRAAGWRVVGALPASEAKYVVIVAPHTSNWDFLLGLAAMFAVGLRAGWIDKHTLFRGPLGALLRRL